MRMFKKGASSPEKPKGGRSPEAPKSPSANIKYRRPLGFRNRDASDDERQQRRAYARYGAKYNGNPPLSFDEWKKKGSE